VEDSPLEQTKQHIKVVAFLCNKLAAEIISRGPLHDASKLEQDEWPHFERETPLLKTMVFGSDEYKESLLRLKPALDHHYSSNRHHPEHFENGIEGMTLVDVVEMFCDWVAASRRGKDGDPIKGIGIAAKRFNMPPMLEQVFKNTVKHIADEDGI